MRSENKPRKSATLNANTEPIKAPYNEPLVCKIATKLESRTGNKQSRSSGSESNGQVVVARKKQFSDNYD